MNNKRSSIVNFFSKLFISLVLFQLPFVNQVFCIEVDGHTAIETVQLGKCNTAPYSPVNSSKLDQECSSHEESCLSCTDIPLDKEIISRLESDNGLIKILNPAYFNLYIGDFNSHLRFSSISNLTFIHKQPAFVFHPTQILQMIILII
jgi:hypothetical protein